MPQQKRNRPQITTTISPFTFAVITQVAKEQAFEKTGPTLDYIVHDWVGLKRAAIETARVSQEQPA